MTPTHDVETSGLPDVGQQHTPEPWVADIPYIHAGDDEQNIAECFEDPERDGDAARDEMWANVRRIVACVNALKGVPTEELEEYVRDGGALHFTCCNGLDNEEQP